MPFTRYYYTVTLSPTKKDPPEHHDRYPYFYTFPEAGQAQPFSFGFGSCFRPEKPPYAQGQIFKALEDRIQLDQLRFMLMIGDQIYADSHTHNNLGRIANNLEDYRSVYEYTWSRPLWRRAMMQVPVFMTMDDHEVDNDWYWADNRRLHPQIPVYARIGRALALRRPFGLSVQRIKDALQAYWEHQLMHAPFDFLSDMRDQLPQFDENYQYHIAGENEGAFSYRFTYGGAAFFVLDTRIHRVRLPWYKRRFGKQQNTILGEPQWQTLEDWLKYVKTRYPVKFIVTSSALLSRSHIDIVYDRWEAFKEERKRLVNFIADEGIKGVYFLSGDVHSAHIVRADLQGKEPRPFPVWEFCSSPFEQHPSQWGVRLFLKTVFGKVMHIRRVFSAAETNFCVVTVSYTADGKPQVTPRFYGRDGVLLYPEKAEA
jgi:alkaline phosphatase D